MTAMRASALSRMVLLGLSAVLACAGGGGETVEPGDWKMVLNHNGEEITVPLKSMDVFLVEDESYPEYFSIESEGAVLGGNFPGDLHVGYEEEWKRLFGKPILIDTQGGDPREMKDCYVELAGGVRSRVTGGTIIFEKLSGKVNGSKGDLTLTGRIMLTVETEQGIENVAGTISVQAVTWG